MSEYSRSKGRVSPRKVKRVAGWTRLPVDTTLGRVFKEVDRCQVVALETLNHRLRGRVWRRAVQTGEHLRSAALVMWVDVDSTVETVFGEQEGTAKGYNEHKRGALSYHPLLGFCAETKEILQGWLRSGDEQLRRWEMQTVRTFLIRVAGKLARGSRQLTRKTPKEHLHARFRSRQDTAAKHRFGSRPPSRRFPDPVAPSPPPSCGPEKRGLQDLGNRLHLGVQSPPSGRRSSARHPMPRSATAWPFGSVHCERREATRVGKRTRTAESSWLSWSA